MALHRQLGLDGISRVLIIRLSSIGDVANALPVAAALLEARPDLQISWLVEEMSAGVVEMATGLHEVIVIPRSRWKQGRWNSISVWREYVQLLFGLHARRFELSLDLQGYGKSAVYALAASAPRRYGWRRMRDGSNLVSPPPAEEGECVHRTEWFLEALRPLGIVGSRPAFQLSVPKSASESAVRLLAEQGVTLDAGFVVLNPATGDETRRWGADRFGEAAALIFREFGLLSVLVGSGKDEALCRTVVECSERFGAHGDGLPRSVAGRTDIPTLAALLQMARVQISGDTGSLHLSAALGKPVVGLYGPTDPLHAGPWDQADNVISSSGMCSAECSSNECGLRKSPRGSSSAEAVCMEAIPVSRVMARVGQILNG